MARKSSISSNVVAVALIMTSLLTLAGCNSEVTKFFNETIGPIIGITLPDPNAQSKKDSNPKEPELPSADNRQLNADFIRELYRVVLLRDLRNRDEFDRYMTMMDQGGHYEGIYNGIVYSNDYKEKEKGVASVTALKAFSEILAQLKLDQKYDSLQIANESEPAKDKIAPPQPTDAERQTLRAEIERDELTKSPFYFKRVLGEQVIKTIELKREYREKLATWYGRFSALLNKRGVDFGIPDRNKPSEYFHYKWALTADEDRLTWECINRVHRLINSTAGLPEPVSAEPPPPPTSGSAATNSGANVHSAK